MGKAAWFLGKKRVFRMDFSFRNPYWLCHSVLSILKIVFHFHLGRLVTEPPR